MILKYGHKAVTYSLQQGLEATELLITNPRFHLDFSDHPLKSLKSVSKTEKTVSLQNLYIYILHLPLHLLFYFL